MPDETTHSPRRHPAKVQWVDWAGGASLGALLGLLIGLSTTPVVSIVITAIVALLAGYFGISDKLPLGMSLPGAHRLMAFAISATLFAMGGIWVRTHEVLAPSVEQQKAMLRGMGYADNSKEQIEMLRYLRFNLLPTGATAAKDPQRLSGVLFADPTATFCDDLSRTRTFPDLLVLLSQSQQPLPRLGDRLKNLAAEKQAGALEFAKVSLCLER
jgi:hypothetical protein